MQRGCKLVREELPFLASKAQVPFGYNPVKKRISVRLILLANSISMLTSMAKVALNSCSNRRFTNKIKW